MFEDSACIKGLMVNQTPSRNMLMQMNSFGMVCPRKRYMMSPLKRLGGYFSWQHMTKSRWISKVSD